MQRLIRFRQRRVLLPNHDPIGPIGWTNCNISGVASKTASDFRIANNNEGTDFWYLIKVGNSLCMCVAVIHQPVLAFEVWGGIGVEWLVSMKQDLALDMQELEGLQPDSGEFLQGSELGVRPSF